MQVITTHENADFDALASLVAAGKLYPEAQAVYPGKLNQNVQEFVSLYKDVLQIKTHRQVDLKGITRLIVTDTGQRKRLPLFQQQWEKIKEIFIYDHHPQSPDDLPAQFKVVEQVGATTTILVEEIFRKGIALSPFEATLFILGIFEDTGCLTFENTTLRDVKVVYHLWQVGVNLRVLSTFLRPPLSVEQRRLFDKLFSATAYHEFQGLQIGIACAENEDYVDGLGGIAQKLLEIEDVDAFFAIVGMEKKIYLTGRSRTTQLDLGAVLAPFGGRGHRGAAAAVLTGTTVAEVQVRLQETLAAKIPPAPTVGAIMSKPVRTVQPQTTVDEAYALMLRYGHGGFPVVENGRLVGLISRRDLDKAVRHGLGHAPVKGYMSKKLYTVTVKTPIDQAQHLLIAHDIGRLPVVENDQLIGIVTRTDILRALEKHEPPRGETGLVPGDDLTPLIQERLPKKKQGQLYLIGQKADREKVKVYVVGGFVRDLLLGRPTHDLDLAEPLAIPFAHKLKNYLGGKLVTHEQFGTATLTLDSGEVIDLVTARQEFYARPAALPEVEMSSLRNDLYRRDFTINTLAISLNAPHFGRLIDFFGGLKDLEAGIIRVLYNLSFVEDPLRVLRAVRFEQRFGFQFDETTKSLLENAVQTRVLEKVTKERLYEEFALIFQEEKAALILARLFKLGIAHVLFPGVRASKALYARLYKAADILSWAKEKLPGAQPSAEALYLTAVMKDLPFQEARHLCRCLRLPRESSRKILSALENTAHLLDQLRILEKPQPSRIDELFAQQYCETLLFLLVCEDQEQFRQYIVDYWQNYRHVKTALNGHDLEALGFRPGPRFQLVLKALRAARLDGQITAREQEVALARKLLSSDEGEENPVAGN